MTTNFLTKPNIIWGILSIIGTILILCFSNIPFFWDNVSISQIADVYYQNHLRITIMPPTMDYGAFTLYAYYLAIFWTIFGKSLLVSHIAFIPVFVGVLWEIKCIGNLILKDKYLVLFLILIFIDPALLTQSLLIAYDMFLLYFMLHSIRMIWQNRKLAYSFSLIFLSLISVRGVIFVFCMLLIHISIWKIRKLKINQHFFALYLPVFCLMMVWMIWHYHNTGWILFTNERNPFRHLNSPLMVWRSAGFVIWKLIDSGRIVLWLIVSGLGLLLFVIWRKKSNCKILAATFLIPLIIYSLILIIISNPVGHKYFLVTDVFLSFICTILVFGIPNKKIKIGVYILTLIAMVAGNFFMHPQRFGNAWDTSLKVIPFFGAEQQMKDFVETQKIPPRSIFTEFPLTTNRRDTYLTEDFSYSELVADSLGSYPYILFSNVINTADMSPYQKIKNNWELIKEIKSGQVILALYKNPEK